MEASRLNALEARHAELDRMIDEEEHRPLPDQIMLVSLKKKKLRVKEEMQLH